MRRLLSLLLLLLASGASARDFWHPETLNVLPPDEAFQLMPAEARGDTLRVSWDIAPGYYLYRGRMKFEVAEPVTARLGEPLLPAGEKIHDEHFGDVEIYRGGTLLAQLPAKPGAIRKLRVTYQGCAEIGICLPPQVRILDVLPESLP